MGRGRASLNLQVLVAGLTPPATRRHPLREGRSAPQGTTLPPPIGGRGSSIDPRPGQQQQKDEVHDLKSTRILDRRRLGTTGGAPHLLSPPPGGARTRG